MSTPDQVPVPAEQGLGLPEGPPLTPTAKEPTQPGEQRSVSWSQVRSGHLTTEVGNLMVEHDDFGPRFFVVASSQAVQLDDSDKGKAEQREGRGPVLSQCPTPQKPYAEHPDGILGTHWTSSGRARNVREAEMGSQPGSSDAIEILVSFRSMQVPTMLTTWW